MASQAQLEADIALARAQVASLELQLDAASGSPQPDPAVIADVERQLTTARNTLIRLQNELNNLLVTSDPNTNLGVVVTPIPINNENTDAGEVQPETVTSPVSVTENVFDPGTTINAGEENVFDPGTTFNTGEESVFDPTGNNGNTGA